MLTYGRRIPLPELDYRIEQIDAKTVREVCTRYIYDKCPALVGIGIQSGTMGGGCGAIYKFKLGWGRWLLNGICFVNLQACANIMDWICYVLPSPPPGPIEQLPDYNRIRGNMYWFRT